jgi:transcriptional regulator with XRE-family HTH domain
MDLDFVEDGAGQDLLDSASARQKTSLRLKYEAESRVFLGKFGGLENIRRNLGFSQRKMSQLLMVDPSAWSRWIKDESRVPPHICRSLEWLLNLEGKNPELMRVLSAGLMAPGRSEKLLDQGPLLERISQLEQEIDQLKKKKLTEISKFMTLLIGLFALALLLILIK